MRTMLNTFWTLSMVYCLAAHPVGARSSTNPEDATPPSQGVAQRATGSLTIDRPGGEALRWRFDLVRGPKDVYQLLLFSAADPSTVRRTLWTESAIDTLLW
ncbi:MAG: hypothetical protein K8J08_22560, partial [Thermoanaerobaculia bacterium]|nr:hypothetical protein [Thermoanaerobaculia bacterium]